jgi:S-adenosylmethionine:tRNA ribosyltransferase-isomerase
MCTKGSGGRVELLVLDPAGVGSACKPEGPAARVCLVRSSKPLRAGTEVQVISGPRLKVEDRVAPGRVRIRFPVEEREFQGWLDRFGLPPLPPYIKPESRDAERDRLAYQTVYAKTPGSVAAPTAGLHFTEELLREIERRGIETARILLHVGPGTFTPVRHEDIRLHRMESEFYDITESEADRISRASQENRRIIAIGTTSVRALESAATAEGKLANSQGSTSLFITPGYDFKLVKGMVTNFHLPGSTLLMLVCAFAGTDLIRKAYEEAMRRKYRFYSYGDACLLFD